MSNQQKKRYPLFKFLGSIVMLATIGGVLFALAGQLEFFGSEEPAKTTADSSSTKEVSSIAKTNNSTATTQTPKYNFIDELQNRRSELESRGETMLEVVVANSKKQQGVNQANAKTTAKDTVQVPLVKKRKGDKREDYRYVIQIGAFGQKKSAEVVKKRASALGYDVEIVSPRSKYLVQAGPLQGISNARAAQKYLKKNKFDTLIKRLK